ncbi:gamma-glutamyltransferase family protein [Candidatus Riflebacteria bacterium]
MKIEKIENNFYPSTDGKCAVEEGGMVSTAFPHATEAGIEMLNMGGNAIDAACAAAFALCVCEPQASGIFGQSMAILSFQGKMIAIDGSSRVPSLAQNSKFKKGERFKGYKATTVPSTPAVLSYLNFRYGKLKWHQILEPAIKIAREGYLITRLQHSLQLKELENFLDLPARSGANYFLKNGKEPYMPGDLFIQKDLAGFLENMAENGVKYFYLGEVARQIELDMKDNGGFLRAEDLAFIPWPIEREPIRRSFRGISVNTLPPPAAGETLLLVLLMLENLQPRFLRSNKNEKFHYLAETIRKALLLRRQRPFDPNTYPQNPEKKMLNRKFAGELARSICNNIDSKLPLFEPPGEDSDTTHLSVMDKEGNAIGITQSIERVYGSKVAAEGLGFLYNNYMMALDTNDPSHPYFLRPNAIPWTSVAPAILTLKKKPWLVVGSPGSERIYSTIAQFLLHIINGELPMDLAMKAPRMHCTIGGKIFLEAEGFTPGLITYLEEIGYTLEAKEEFSFFLGAIQAVMKFNTRTGFAGVAEIRRDGTAGGPK